MPDLTPNLPQEMTWKLLAVSKDMMDTRFCNKRFPFRWRSSLAISAFEPKPEDLPEELCEGRITVLKITATITGYQPSREETDEGYVSFPNVPTEELSRIIDQYFACYGAMLQVAVFPNPDYKLVDKRVAITFDQNPGTLLSNPYETTPFENDKVFFEAVGQPNNRIVDIFPPGGDTTGELDLFEKLVVTLPSTSQVEAKVVHFSADGVTMEAFAGGTSVGVEAAGPEQGEMHPLAISGAGIDRVIFTAAQDQASLLEFAYLAKEAKPLKLIEYPHIIDVEPKKRELIQAATEANEILTTSKSTVKSNKGNTNTENTETGFKFGVKGEKFSGEITHKNTEAEQENWSVDTDASRERQEKEGSTTQISQLYNLLSSYHVDTNRLGVLMVARPHVLQATDHRTFVDGLRKIEGTQQFLVIVARSPEMRGLCVEAFLETGHFPEGLTPEEPEEKFYEDFEEFDIEKVADNCIFCLSGETVSIETTYDILRPDFIIDGKKGDDGHPGVSEISDNSNPTAKSSLKNYSYRAISPTTVKVEGSIQGAGAGGPQAIFDRKYRVFTRSQKPKPNSGEPRVPLDKLLITSRGLCVCFLSGEKCPELDPRIILEPEIALSIVDESEISINPDVLTRHVTRETRLPAMKILQTEILNALAKSGRLLQRRPFGTVGFLDCDYFKDQIKKVLPNDHLNSLLVNVSDLPKKVVESLGEKCTVAEALELNLARFSQKTGLDIADAVKARRRLLGMAAVPSQE